VTEDQAGRGECNCVSFSFRMIPCVNARPRAFYVRRHRLGAFGRNFMHSELRTQRRRLARLTHLCFHNSLVQYEACGWQLGGAGHRIPW